MNRLTRNAAYVFIWDFEERPAQPPSHSGRCTRESGDCEFEGFGVTLARYPLIVDRLFNIPFLLDVTDNPNAVVSNADEVHVGVISLQVDL